MSVVDEVSPGSEGSMLPVSSLLGSSRSTSSLVVRSSDGKLELAETGDGKFIAVERKSKTSQYKVRRVIYFITAFLFHHTRTNLEVLPTPSPWQYNRQSHPYDPATAIATSIYHKQYRRRLPVVILRGGLSEPQPVVAANPSWRAVAIPTLVLPPPPWCVLQIQTPVVVEN